MSKALSPQEMEALVAAGDLDIVDVRSPREWAEGHVPGARLVPLDTLRADPDKALTRDHVVFVCAKGIRSQTAADIAESRGLKDVYTLDGGTLAWAKAGLPIVVPETPADAPRDKDEKGESLPILEPFEEPGLDAIIAANLRELRTKRGLTLDMLAKASGVARTTLGQIELARARPSIGVIWKIAQALGVPFSTLLTTHGPVGTSVMRRSSGKRLLSADGRFASRALFPFGEPRTVEFYELWLAPHSKEEAEPHQPGTRENLVVASGRLELKVGGTTHLLEKGDAILFAADVPHVYTNPDGEECWMHLVMTYRDPVG